MGEEKSYFLDEDIKPKQLVGLTIFGGEICGKLFDKGAENEKKNL